MHKLPVVLPALAAGMMWLGHAQAQQTPAAQASKPASTQSTGGTAKTAGAKKSTPTSTKTGSALTLKTQREKASYALGMSLGSSWHRQQVPVDPALVARGVKDALSGGKTLLTEDEMKAALAQLQSQYQQAQQAKAHAEGEANRKSGEAFLEANKSKEGVKALPDGLEYKVLKEGTGPKPTASDTVTVNYRGTLVDGKEFDSSYAQGKPVTFPVNGVIKGWTEALQLMPVGSKWQLFIPADLAYGDNPRPGGLIKPGDTLIFDVELLSIGEQKK